MLEEAVVSGSHRPGEPSPLVAASVEELVQLSVRVEVEDLVQVQVEDLVQALLQVEDLGVALAEEQGWTTASSATRSSPCRT